MLFYMPRISASEPWRPVGVCPGAIGQGRAAAGYPSNMGADCHPRNRHLGDSDIQGYAVVIFSNDRGAELVDDGDGIYANGHGGCRDFTAYLYGLSFFFQAYRAECGLWKVETQTDTRREGI